MNSALKALGVTGYQGPVLLINNDVRIEFGMRRALKKALTINRSATLIAPQIIQNGVKQGWLFYQPWLALVTHEPIPGSFPYLSGCCLFVNRTNNSKPLFDEDFFMYGEDVELSYRIRRQGGTLLLLSETWLVHEGSASSGVATTDYERFIVESHWLLAKKLEGRFIQRIIMHILRVPSLLIRACVRSLRFKSLIPLRALLPLGTSKSYK